MEHQGLLSLAQLLLPSDTLLNFEVVRVEEDNSLIRIYLDEIKDSYKKNSDLESEGFRKAVVIRDFPIRNTGVDLIVRRRRWYEKSSGRYFSKSYGLKAREPATRKSLRLF